MWIRSFVRASSVSILIAVGFQVRGIHGFIHWLLGGLAGYADEVSTREPQRLGTMLGEEEAEKRNFNAL